jgi:hypothetical protein
MSLFSGIYYPYATEEQKQIIKIAAIYFDKIYIMSPITIVDKFSTLDKYRKSISLVKKYIEPSQIKEISKVRDRETIEILKFQDETKLLQDEGVVEFINPFKDPDTLQLQQIFDDLEDSLFQEFLMQTLEEKATASHGTALAADIWANISSHKMSDHQLYEFRRDFILATLVHHTAIASITLNATPFTNIPDFHDLLRHKIQTIFAQEALVKKPLHQDSFLGVPIKIDGSRIIGVVHVDRPQNYTRQKKALRYYKQNNKIKANFLAIETIKQNLPNFELESYEDILVLREKLKDQLEQFRTMMAKIAADIQSLPWDDDFQADLNRVIDRDINPVLLDLQKKLQSSTDRFILRVLKNVKSTKSIISFIATLFAGLPLPYAAAISAGVIGLDAAFNVYFENKEIRVNNGLSFLLDI